ncbi:MAG: hypothetical protein JOY60_10920 [Burkholderiaceae bacterium]|nr:hypothetical protein [Burkholderiaceae bacterium]
MRKDLWNLLRAPRLERRHIISIHTDGQEINSRQLVGEASFDEGLTVRDENTSHLVPVVQLRLNEIASAARANDEAESPKIVGGIWVDQYDDAPSVIAAEVFVHLPKSVFQTLWESAHEGSEIWLKVWVLPSDEPTDLMLPGVGRNSINIHVSEIACHPAGTTLPSWLEDRRVEQLRKAFQETYFERSYGEQVRVIGRELSLGLARIEKPQERIDKLAKVLELIGDARVAFRAPLRGPDSKLSDNAYYLKKPEFEAFIAQFDEKRQEELRRSFGMLWTYLSIHATVQQGEDAIGPAKNGLQCMPDDLDRVAAAYCELGDLRSKTLEWALLAALTYSECLGFAQFVNADENFLGLPPPEPLKGPQSKRSWKKAVRVALVELASESIALGLSFGVAWALTQGNETATWVVMTGYTAWRWMRKLILRHEQNPKLKSADLLTKMFAISESFKRYDFNARSVRQLVQSATQDGAVYSPWVLNLLDRMVLDLETDR